MFNEIARLYDRIKQVREAMVRIQAVEFDPWKNRFENNREAEEAMAGLKNESGKIHEQMKALREKLRNDMYKLVKSYLDKNGEDETVDMLFQLKRWHPWSYEYFFEIADLFRLKGEKSLNDKINRRLFPFMNRS